MSSTKSWVVESRHCDGPFIGALDHRIHRARTDGSNQSDGLRNSQRIGIITVGHRP